MVFEAFRSKQAVCHRRSWQSSLVLLTFQFKAAAVDALCATIPQPQQSHTVYAGLCGDAHPEAPFLEQNSWPRPFLSRLPRLGSSRDKGPNAELPESTLQCRYQSWLHCRQRRLVAYSLSAINKGSPPRRRR